MPGYAFALDGDMVEIRAKPGLPPPALPGPALRLLAESYELGRELAPGWDIHALEADWRDWIAKKGIVPRLLDSHFLAFCKRRGKHVAFQ